MQTPRSSVVRTLCLSLGLFAPCILIGALCLAQPGQKADKVETAGHKFKNIKVLKTLPADQLIPLMRKWNASLGVRCDFCHVINADHTGFERDDKPTKGMARTMVNMTNDINKRQKVLNGGATCFMCHHGHPEPQMQPEAAEGGEKK